MRFACILAVSIALCCVFAAPVNAQESDLDQARNAYLEKMQEDGAAMDSKRDAYLSGMTQYGADNSAPASPENMSARSGTDEDLPRGPSAANRSDKPVKPLTKEEMFGE